MWPSSVFKLSGKGKLGNITTDTLIQANRDAQLSVVRDSWGFFLYEL